MIQQNTVLEWSNEAVGCNKSPSSFMVLHGRGQEECVQRGTIINRRRWKLLHGPHTNTLCSSRHSVPTVADKARTANRHLQTLVFFLLSVCTHALAFRSEVSTAALTSQRLGHCHHVGRHAERLVSPQQPRAAHTALDLGQRQQSGK